jgi:hypothetical protein
MSASCPPLTHSGHAASKDLGYSGAPTASDVSVLDERCCPILIRTSDEFAAPWNFVPCCVPVATTCGKSDVKVDFGLPPNRERCNNTPRIKIRSEQ